MSMLRSYVDLRCENHHCGFSWRLYDHKLALNGVGMSIEYPCPECGTSTAGIIALNLASAGEDEWPDIIDA